MTKFIKSDFLWIAFLIIYESRALNLLVRSGCGLFPRKKPVEYRMHSNVAQTSGIHIHTLGNGYIQMYLLVGKPVFHLCPIDVCLMFATRLDGQQCKVWGLQFIATKLQTSDWRTRQCTIQTLQTFQKVWKKNIKATIYNKLKNF